MDSQLEALFQQFDAAATAAERQRVSKKLQAIYTTLSTEELEQVKKRLKPDMDALRAHLQSVDALIDTTLAKYQSSV